MKDYIFTGLAPNTQKDDIALAWRLLFRPDSWISCEAIGKVEEWFKSFLPVEYAVSFVSGRGALHAILSSIGLKAGDEVLLQAYTCVSVPGAALAAGGKPVYVDIEPNTLNMSSEDLERKITHKSRALIIQ
ncbi:MAG: aminotransferase class I/II-fold pyridoxal phosphate-dependent enzyme, partial [bacterium]|nr:aminotransferase class I/II-fold pyridoxal phosphate-dependent enzyme [bacterium]